MPSKLPLRLVFARNLRLFRVHVGLSQEKLAAEAGLDRAFVGTLERGQRNISIDNIELLCKAVAMPAHEMLDPDFPPRYGLDESVTRSPRTARPYPADTRPRAPRRR
jgi:transcriptional regulator with XRE-family HTH domain